MWVTVTAAATATAATTIDAKIAQEAGRLGFDRVTSTDDAPLPAVWRSPASDLVLGRLPERLAGLELIGAGVDRRRAVGLPAALAALADAGAAGAVEGALPPEEVAEGLGMTGIKDRPWAIFKCSAVKNEGVSEGLDWIATSIMGS